MNIFEDPAAWLQGLVARTTETVAVYLPNLVGALAILLLGWLGALLVRWIILRFGTGLDALMSSLYRRTGRPLLRADAGYGNTRHHRLPLSRAGRYALVWHSLLPV